MIGMPAFEGLDGVEARGLCRGCVRPRSVASNGNETLPPEHPSLHGVWA